MAVGAVLLGIPGVNGKETIKAIYIPLADHYAGLIAPEK